ncbi:hypothetical protein BU17DRAFT_62559 [Hysterangium stoloniferum]|nr:hypothetical protein BU17DRAFT_62559 [Hysterangium stoloniferum]
MSLSFLPLDRAPMFTHSHPDHFYMPPIDDQHSPHTAPSQTHPTIPKLGQTRCYWALLNAGLEFLYIDPVLHSHLGPQADAIIGKSLLEFVHPDEHASAQQDLGKVLESRTLHGSVTRVRYSRLGRTRTRLGYTGPPDTFQDEDKVSFDENYMACDLVINWAAEGLVLCFIHAVTDMSPHDNDENNPTNWTNWCGTPDMGDQDSGKLYRALLNTISHHSHGTVPPTRVFQILKNSTDRPALFSWPAQGYISGDYGQLANDVQIGGANGSDAKTSCTRRYKALQVLNSADGSVRDAESIFIPHGRIIFACHKTAPHSPRGHPSSYPTMYQSPQDFYDSPGQVPYYPTVPSQLDSYTGPGGHPYTYSAHSKAGKSHTQSPLPGSSGRSSPDGVRGHPSYSWAASSSVPHSVPYSDNSPQGSQRQLQKYLDEVPPPRQRGVRLTPEASVGSSRDSYANVGRLSGNPPTGVMRCAACKSTSSPEWRKGPSGKKDLCNACGLRYSRAKAKKDGVSSQRRRKDALKVPSQMPEEPNYKRRIYSGTSHVDFSADPQRVDAGGINYTETPSPSPPRDHPHHPPSHHAIQSNSSLYPYSTLDSGPPMYMASTHTYSHHHHHQPYHTSADFLPSASSPAPGDFATSSSAGLSGGLSAPMSSYERTGFKGCFHQ